MESFLLSRRCQLHRVVVLGCSTACPAAGTATLRSRRHRPDRSEFVDLGGQVKRPFVDRRL